LWGPGGGGQGEGSSVAPGAAELWWRRRFLLAPKAPRVTLSQQCVVNSR
jgi:hypothetical protein